MAHHHHHHDHSHESKNIALAFFLNIGFALLEVCGGYYVNSVAIISDAVHDFGDSFSLGVAWYLQIKSRQGATERYTFGYKRFSLLGALINSLILIAGSVYVMYEAYQRIIAPEPTNAKGMLLFALIGIAVNGFAAFKLSRGKSLNEKVLSWHLMEDVLGWACVLVASVVLLFWDVPLIDPILSLLITAYILYNVVLRGKEVMFVFLQGAPHTVDLPELKQRLSEIEGVKCLHHVHLWSLDEENKIFTIQVQPVGIQSLEALMRLKTKIREVLRTYDIHHATIDVELPGEQHVIEPGAPCGFHSHEHKPHA